MTKHAKLNRIRLELASDDEETTAVLTDTKLADVVKKETLAMDLNRGGEMAFEVTVKVEGRELRVGLMRHARTPRH